MSDPIVVVPDHLEDKQMGGSPRALSLSPGGGEGGHGNALVSDLRAYLTGPHPTRGQKPKPITEKLLNRAEVIPIGKVGGDEELYLHPWKWR